MLCNHKLSFSIWFATTGLWFLRNRYRRHSIINFCFSESSDFGTEGTGGRHTSGLSEVDDWALTLDSLGLSLFGCDFGLEPLGFELPELFSWSSDSNLSS